MSLTINQLLDYKRAVTCILDKHNLPVLSAGICHLLRGEVGAVSYHVSRHLMTSVDYVRYGFGANGVWTDKRYEYLWLIDLLTDNEFLELFPDAIKD